MASSVNNSAWLEWMTALMGGVSRQTAAATFPPDRFYCLLDELPLHLLPQSARGLLRFEENGKDRYLNPECIVCPAGELPERLLANRELLSGFALSGTIAWVPGSAGGSLLPFWLGPEYETVLRGLRPEEPVPASVAPAVRAILSAANILVDGGGAADSPDHKNEEMLGRAAALFRAKAYTPLRNLLHPFHVAALRRYYRHQIRTGAIALGDRQSARRYAAHNEPVARFFHHQIAPLLSAVAGEPLKTSYVYFASYLSGAELKKHTDREQCEFSLTFCLDFSPEPDLATPWPISLDTSRGAVTVYQALGDGLAYRGTRLPHYRAPLPAGQTSTSIFFHYVREDFAGSLL
jgi:hypothetical protein